MMGISSSDDIGLDHIVLRFEATAPVHVPLPGWSPGHIAFNAAAAACERGAFSGTLGSRAVLRGARRDVELDIMYMFAGSARWLGLQASLCVALQQYNGSAAAGLCIGVQEH